MRRLTLEQLRQRAAPYKHRSEFYKNDFSAYDIARRRGVLNEICQHMEYGHRTVAELKEAASKYETLKEFYENDWASYCTAWHKGVLDEVTAGLKRKFNRVKKTR